MRETADVAREPSRRSFLTKLGAVAVGALLGLVPMLAGLFTFFDSVRRSSKQSRRVPLLPLAELPADGSPRAVAVVADRQDAWNRFANEPIGRVWLRRLVDQAGEPRVLAFNAVCPHAGCYVGYQSGAEGGRFVCPCHNSSFNLDGAIAGPSPSPRALDALTAAVGDHAGTPTVWVEFENFYTGRAEKVPKA